VPGRIERVDATSPALTDYVGLTDVALRRRREPAEGLFIAEGEKVIRRAIDAGYPPRSFLLEEKWLPALADLVERVDVPVHLADRETLEEITGYVVHRGALAAMSRLPLEPAADLLARVAERPPCRVAVFEDLVSHTNLGAAMRSAAALGVDAVLVTPRCADPLYRRAIRVSMGTVFQVPWTRIDPWPGGVSTLQEQGFVVATLALADDAVGLDELAADPPERLALVLGTEGDGLSHHTIAAADLTVTIPMAGGVDSLNVAAAGAVAAWALRPSRP
jgi:tRNA G18 (ribose-2'-O)-methylase SpoU